ncbi:MAG: hypothetical protein ACI8P3_003536 [Saprospiraceae bacterium]|jgi:hypothetical protein
MDRNKDKLFLLYNQNLFLLKFGLQASICKSPLIYSENQRALSIIYFPGACWGSGLKAEN